MKITIHQQLILLIMGAQEDIEDEKFKKFRIVLDKNGNTYYNKYCSRFLWRSSSVG